jgi:hypothetical protein
METMCTIAVARFFVCFSSVTSNTRKKRKLSLTRKDDLEREFTDVKVESGKFIVDLMQDK